MRPPLPALSLSASWLLVPCVVGSALLLGGCGGSDSDAATPTPSASLPSGSATVPSGVSTTPPGTGLKFGQQATVAFAPNANRSSVLRLGVTGVTQGSVADLSAYQLDDATRASTPYYVRVQVTNVGTGDLGRSPVPLWGVDQKNTLIQPSSFTNTFTRCPSSALPDAFGPAASVSDCLVYLVPGGGSLTSVSYRPEQSLEPITWTGTIGKPGAKKAGGTKKGASAGPSPTAGSS